MGIRKLSANTRKIPSGVVVKDLSLKGKLQGGKMRITIETTNSEPECSTKVVKESPYDDMDIWTIIDEIKALLLGFGYSEDTVKRAFDAESKYSSVYNKREKKKKNA
jgi:hypothetical protein